MITSLALIAAGLAVMVIGLLVRDGRRESRSRRSLLDCLDAHEESALKLLAAIKGKSRLPYWSCQSTSRARGLAVGLLSQSRTAINCARAAAEQDPDLSAVFEKRAYSLLNEAGTIMRLAETELVPLIDRMRQGVEILHGEASSTRDLIDRWLKSRPDGAAFPEAAQRIAKLANALKAHELSIGSAPVTTLRSLNVQFRVMNEVLEQIVPSGAGDGRPPREGL